MSGGAREIAGKTEPEFRKQDLTVKGEPDAPIPKWTEGQWPDNIISGDIRYQPAHNYAGFSLSDASHGIPTFGSVTENNPPTIRGQHVHVFNYPGQTEAIAAELVKRWNLHPALLAKIDLLTAALRDAEEFLDGRADADCDQDGYIPNDEMKLLIVVRTALEETI